MSAPEPCQTLVLGVGNELYRDDGVGVVVARQLAACVPPGVTVIEGRVGGMDLLFDMEGAAHVIIVDAVDMGQPPGSVTVFTPEEVSMVKLETIASLHQIGLAQVLELGRLVGIAPRLHIVGIQPQTVSAGFDLTETVSRAVPDAVQAVRQLLAADVPSVAQGGSPAGSSSGACS